MGMVKDVSMVGMSFFERDVLGDRRLEDFLVKVHPQFTLNVSGYNRLLGERTQYAQNVEGGIKLCLLHHVDRFLKLNQAQSAKKAVETGTSSLSLATNELMVIKPSAGGLSTTM